MEQYEKVKYEQYVITMLSHGSRDFGKIHDKYCGLVCSESQFMYIHIM